LDKTHEELHNNGILKSFDFGSYDICEACLVGKMTKNIFKGFVKQASELLEIIHTDAYGPMSIPVRGGFLYFITFTGDLSRYGYIYFMKNKSKMFEWFNEFQNEVENQCGKEIKFLRLDRGG
jgi:5'-3' exoribonuclease 2